MNARLRNGAGIATLLLALFFGGAPAWAQQVQKDYTKVRGFVDKETFAADVSPDDVQIEVWLPGALLRLAKIADPELGDLVDGLELLQAVVVETEDAEVSARLFERLERTESSLMKKGWIRLAKVRDGDERISVLILSDDDGIHGLTVMVGDRASFVFANVAGRIDLAAIQKLGRQMSIPGLDQVEVPE